MGFLELYRQNYCIESLKFIIKIRVNQIYFTKFSVIGTNTL